MRVLLLVLLTVHSQELVAETRIVDTKCRNSSFMEGDTADIHFFIRPDIDFANDPHLVMFIKKDNLPGNLIQCDRKNQSTTLVCGAPNGRFLSQGSLMGNELSIIIPNASSNQQGFYELHVVANGAFDPPIGCYLFVEDKAGAQPGEGESGNTMSVVIPAVILAAVLLLIVPGIVFLLRRQKHVKSQRQREGDSEQPRTPTTFCLCICDDGGRVISIARGSIRRLRSLLTGDSRRERRNSVSTDDGNHNPQPDSKTVHSKTINEKAHRGTSVSLSAPEIPDSGYSTPVDKKDSSERGSGMLQTSVRSNDNDGQLTDDQTASVPEPENRDDQSGAQPTERDGLLQNETDPSRTNSEHRNLHTVYPDSATTIFNTLAAGQRKPNKEEPNTVAVARAGPLCAVHKGSNKGEDQRTTVTGTRV